MKMDVYPKKIQSFRYFTPKDCGVEKARYCEMSKDEDEKRKFLTNRSSGRR